MPQTLLEQLLGTTEVYIENDTYCGIAADGTVVQFGMIGDESAIERYLSENQTPDTW